jgi:hypothetical protein
VAVAVKVAVLDPAATVTDAGTVTAEELLVRLTVRALVVVPLSETEQLSEPAPVIELLVQLSALNAGVLPEVAAFNCSEKVCETPLAFADNVAVCEEATAATVAVKPALVAPAATVTDAGTLTDPLLLPNVTVTPPVGAAALSATVQLSVPAPVIDPLVQVSALNAGVLPVVAVPVPLRFTVTVFAALPVELPVTINCPLAAPAPVGAKFTLTLYVPPAATVTGRSPSPLAENTCPVTTSVDTCTAAVPWFTKDTLELAVCPIDTEPNETAVGEA